MSARLDNTPNYGDRNGDVSDPRLVKLVGLVTPPTAAEIAATRRVIDTHALNAQDHTLLGAIILGEEQAAHPISQLKEAA